MSTGFRLIPRAVENPSHPDVLSLCSGVTRTRAFEPHHHSPLELLAEFITLSCWKSARAGGEVRGVTAVLLGQGSKQMGEE